MKITKGIMSGKDLTHYFIDVLSIDGKEKKISNDFTNGRFNSSFNCKVLYENYELKQLVFTRTDSIYGKLEKYVVDCETKSEYLLILNTIKKTSGSVPLESLLKALEVLENEYIEEFTLIETTEFYKTFSGTFFLINNHLFNINDNSIVKNINESIYMLENKKIYSLSKDEFFYDIDSIIFLLTKNNFFNKKCFIIGEVFNFIAEIKNDEGIFLNGINCFVYKENNRVKIATFKKTITNFSKEIVTIVKNKNMKIYFYKRTNEDIGAFTIVNNNIKLMEIHSIENINLDYTSSLKFYDTNILKIRHRRSFYDTNETVSLFKIEDFSLNFIAKYNNFEITLSYKKDNQTVIEKSDFFELYLKDEENCVFINLKTEEIYNNQIKSKLINSFNLNILKTIEYKFEDLLNEPFAENYKFKLKNGIVLNSPSEKKYLYINYKTNEIFELINMLDNVKVFNLLLKKYDKIVIENYLPRVASCYPFATHILTVLKADKHIDWYRSKITKYYLEQYLNN